jgi:hypothetical protein
MCRSVPILIAVALFASTALTQAQDKDKKEPAKSEKPALVVVAPNGKEAKLLDWHFSVGTRHLSLTEVPKGKAGPEYLEFREDKSTTFVEGIITLVPLSAIRKIEYDREKKVTLTTLTDEGETVLTGSTEYKGINKTVIEAEQDIDGLGFATIKFQGGEKSGIHGIIFPAPKAIAPAKGPLSTIIASDKEKTAHPVHDLQPLYKVDGQYRVLPYLMFKKTVKVDMEKLAGLSWLPPEGKKGLSYDFEVSIKGGSKHTLTLLTKIDLTEKKSATLEGLIGRVPAGYKLFPVHTIREMHPGGPKEKLDARLDVPQSPVH